MVCNLHRVGRKQRMKTRFCFGKMHEKEIYEEKVRGQEIYI